MNKTIYLAGGCFWGVEAYFQKVSGIIDTTVGYANGDGDKTNYHNLSITHHAEAVKIVYDSNVINVAEIIERYFLIINPFSLNRQGNDIGQQYRTGIYYEDEYTKKVAIFFKDLIAKENNKKVLIEIEQIKNFVVAEEYHQDYLIKNPSGYCHLDFSKLEVPLSRAKEKTVDEIKSLNLDIQSLDIMLRQHTEHPFTSKFNEFDSVGLFVDKISKEALFSSEDKFDAGCGWPSFTKGITTDAINYYDDFSHNRHRIEVKSAIQNNHLGHVFEDGPKNTGGKRYCINGLALDFIPLEELAKEGYTKYLAYFKKFIENY